MTEPKVAAAVGFSHAPTVRRPAFGKSAQDAFAQAVQECIAKGIPLDSDEAFARVNDARIRNRRTHEALDRIAHARALIAELAQRKKNLQEQLRAVDEALARIHVVLA